MCKQFLWTWTTLIDIWYKIEGRAVNSLEGFTGKNVTNLLEKIKEKSCLTSPADMLQLFVKRQGSEEEKSLLELEDESEEFNIENIVSEYEIRRKNPIIVRLPGIQLSL